MKYQLLLLWSLTVFVSGQEVKNEITVSDMPDGIKLTCGSENVIPSGGKTSDESKGGLDLHYKDEYTGEYRCEATDSKIYVKFRTCDNCVELDMASIAGIVAGDVVATVVVGVAVYLIASKSRPSPNATTKKKSDRQPLVSNEVRNRSSNDHYQPLRSRQAQGRDEYDVLRK